jgi:endonuclease YncB( thermonuclease family)
MRRSAGDFAHDLLLREMARSSHIIPVNATWYQAPFQAAEAQARAATQGMWAQGERYESPRVYRRRVGISASTP